MKPSTYIPWVVAAAIATSLAAYIAWMSEFDAPSGLRGIEKYTDLQAAAISDADALIERGLTLTLALVSLFGAALLGLHERLKFSRADAVAAGVALFFCVASSISGVFAKIKITEMKANGFEPYLTEPIIAIPLTLQLYTIVFALAAIAWMIAYKVFVAASEKVA